MIAAHIFFYIFIMWILILIGCGILVIFTAPITISGFGELDALFSSLIKAVISIGLIAVWIFIFSKIKNWLFIKRVIS